MAILVWISFVLKSEIILAIVSTIFLLSALLKVRRAPMIRLYELLFQKIKRSSEILVDENAIFFAHSVALVMSLSTLSVVHWVHTSNAWYPVLAFAVLKTISAFGFCPASKLYDCTLNGNCCIKKTKNGNQPSCL
jgi:hypothetical protein